MIPNRYPKRYRVVLLTGAGSSALVGLKTLKPIVDSIYGAQVPLDNQDPTVELVKETWAVIRGQKGDNATLEDLLGRLKLYAQTADLIMSDTAFRDALKVNLNHVMNGQFKRQWEDALGYCFRLMIENYGPHKVNANSSGYKTIVEVLRLLSQQNDGTLHVFTTNYDCLFNVMAARSDGMSFYSHINPEDKTFAKEWFVCNKTAYEEENPCIYIHRLHGCISWFSDPRNPYGVHEVFDSVENLAIDDQSKLNQMAIKLVSDDRIGSIPAFSLAFDELHFALKECDILLIWGHSFKDLEVLRCMINVSENRRDRPFDIYYVDSYLDIGLVKEHMWNTVAGVPALSSTILEPKRINWVTQDGLTELVKMIGQVFESQNDKKGRKQ